MTLFHSSLQCSKILNLCYNALIRRITSKKSIILWICFLSTKLRSFLKQHASYTEISVLKKLKEYLTEQTNEIEEIKEIGTKGLGGILDKESKDKPLCGLTKSWGVRCCGCKKPADQVTHCLLYCLDFLKVNVDAKATIACAGGDCMICLHPKHKTEECNGKNDSKRICSIN